MKKSIIFSILFCTTLCLLGQNTSTESSSSQLGLSVVKEPFNIKPKVNFTEYNFGMALLEDVDFVFPGTSFLIGQTNYFENGLILEYQIGVAIPSVITGKIGIGKKFENTDIVVGVRPFPFNLYVQPRFKDRDKGYWIMSIEFNPLDSGNSLSFYSRGLVNFGYRWVLNR